jgi:tetratricopeptide (TPR) repeat protein
LFNQLLEGVASGWQPARIIKFFAQLDDRATKEDWIAWLGRFSDKMINSPTPHRQLASRMLRFGEMTESTPAIRGIGEVAAQSGKKLLMKGFALPIWEYSGPDVQETPSPEQTAQEIPPPIPSPPEEIAPPTESLAQGDESLTESLAKEIAPPTESPAQGDEIAGESAQPVNPPSETPQEAITLDELLARLQQDANLVRHIAQQLGIETDDPQIVFETIVKQLNAAQAAAENPKIPAPVEAWFNRGLEQAQAGDFEEAITSWNKALELNPNLPQAWHNRGSALAELGRLEEAIASFDQAIALNPQDYTAWNDKGNALYNLQQWEKAIACWQRVVQIQSDYYQAWYNQACALENLGRLTEAIDCYQECLKIQPQFELALARRNNIQKRLGDSNSP